jgi:hypothetical protein
MNRISFVSLANGFLHGSVAEAAMEGVLNGFECPLAPLVHEGWT